MSSAQRQGGSTVDRADSPRATDLIHERIAAQAALTPDALAVVAGEQSLDYAELDRRADRLAAALDAAGAGPETVVGVCLPRGLDLVVALLAVWKAGAAYLPLDPEHPVERVAGLLSDAGARLVVGIGGTIRAAAARTGTTVLDPAVTGDPAETRPGDARVADADNAAYVLYTSGSTGRPKGVVVTHGGIANRVRWTVERHGLRAGDRVLQKTSLSFDAHCWEFFAPLMSGATVVLAPVGAERDPAALVAAVVEQGITVLQGVPTVLRLMAEEPDWQAPALRLLFSAGEPLQAELVQQLRAHAPAAEVWNTYGPTECSIDVTAQQADPEQATGPVAIGRPIEGMRVLVLGRDGRPVPIGVPGELFVGGVGVARGYLGRADLTAERFVPDPYGPAGGRLYRTGDKVRWRADRTLEYLGRLDDQVKVNGVRLEPAEVEAVLLTHPGLRGAVVTARPTGTGALRLVAHVVAADPAPTATELRDFLRERLPDTHVPAVLAFLDAFPQTAGGKIDRRALPEPAAPEAASAASEPRTEAERLVAGIWRQLLKVEQVGPEDDFFALGGTSLQLTRLANRLRQASGKEIRLRGLFSATTLAAQAELIAEAVPDVPPVVPVDRGGPLPLSFGQRRLWFLDQLNPGSPEWVSPLFVRIAEDTAEHEVSRALDALTARHESLRTRYTAVDGEPVQVIDAPRPVELRTATAEREQLPALLSELFARGFDLEHGPLLRGLLVRIPGESQVLVLAFHHIAVDGWSSVVLERELRVLLDDAEAVLPALPVQYADYAAWQRAQLTDQETERLLGHWRGGGGGAGPRGGARARRSPASRRWSCRWTVRVRRCASRTAAWSRSPCRPPSPRRSPTSAGSTARPRS